MKAALKLVVFCPLPPKPNGIADYFYEQIPLLSQKVSLSIVVPNDQFEVAPLPSGVNVYRLSEYLFSRDKFNDFHHLYHVGNNADAVYLLPVLLSTPGTVVIHDLNLHHLIDLTTLAQGEFNSYQTALEHDYGFLGRQLGAGTKKRKWKGTFSTSQLLLNASVIDAANSVIVHSQYAAQIVRGRYHPRVAVIPHHLAPEVDNYGLSNRDAYRKSLELPTDRTVFTSMGFIAKAKQIRAVLESLVQLKSQGFDPLYVLAGQCKPHEYDVFADIKELNLENNVRVTGFLSESDFYTYLGASDFIVNLRYPSGGESSGTLTRALGMGLACVVINTGPFAEIPDNCALKLNYTSAFKQDLLGALKELISDQNKAAAIGLEAKKWVQGHHRIEQTVPAYLEVVKNCIKARELNPVITAEQLVTVNSRRAKANLALTGGDPSDPWETLLKGTTVHINTNAPSVLLVGAPSHVDSALSELTSCSSVDNKELAALLNDQHVFQQIFSVVCASDFSETADALLKVFNRLLVIGGELCFSIYTDSNSLELPLQRSIQKHLDESGFRLESIQLLNDGSEDYSFDVVNRIVVVAKLASRMCCNLDASPVIANLLTVNTATCLAESLSRTQQPGDGVAV